MTNRDQVVLNKITSIDLDEVNKILNKRNKDIDEKLSALQDVDDKVTDWEIDFINSCTDYFEKNSCLTDKQYETVLRIYQKYCL